MRHSAIWPGAASFCPAAVLFLLLAKFADPAAGCDFRAVYFSQDVLYDQSGVKLLASGVMSNRDGETALLLELENTTDNMVYLSTSDIAINGLLVNSSTWSNDAINPGKRCIVDVDLSTVLDPAY